MNLEFMRSPPLDSSPGFDNEARVRCSAVCSYMKKVDKNEISDGNKPKMDALVVCRILPCMPCELKHQRPVLCRTTDYQVRNWHT